MDLPNPIRPDGTFKLERLPMPHNARAIAERHLSEPAFSLVKDKSPIDDLQLALVVQSYRDLGFRDHELPDILVEADGFLRAYSDFGLGTFDATVDILAPTRRYCERVGLSDLASAVSKAEAAAIDAGEDKFSYGGPAIWQHLNSLQYEDEQFWIDACRLGMREIFNLDPFYRVRDADTLKAEQARLLDLLPNYFDRHRGQERGEGPWNFQCHPGDWANSILEKANERLLSNDPVKLHDDAGVLVRDIPAPWNEEPFYRDANAVFAVETTTGGRLLYLLAGRWHLVDSDSYDTLATLDGEA